MTEKKLYQKYQVYKDGEEVDGFVFVLRPDRDFAAFMALQSYATFVDDEDFAYEIFEYTTQFDEKYAEQLKPHEEENDTPGG